MCAAELGKFLRKIKRLCEFILSPIGRRAFLRLPPCASLIPMSPRPDLGPKPRLGYTESRIERAAELRPDEAAMAKLAADPRAGAYVVGGDLIVMKKAAAINEPLFTFAEARAFGSATETVFLGLLDGAPRFGFGIDPKVAAALKDERADLLVTDLR